MTLPLSLPHTIANDLSADGDQLAANLDAIVDAVNSDLLPTAGGTLTGDLTLAGDPDSTLKAATKQYVDNRVPTTVFERTADIALSTSSEVVANVTFTSESNDSDGWATMSTTDLVCPATGLYIVTYELDLNKVAASGGLYTLAAGPYFYDGSNNYKNSGTTRITSQPSTNRTDPSAFVYSSGEAVYVRSGEILRFGYQFTSLSGTQTMTIENVKVLITKLPL